MPQTNMNPQSPISTLLREGINAVKAGELDKARTLLMQVVEQDEANEPAWLWLSGVVETDEDRRICLENVLALNPNNSAAQRGLAKLGPAVKGPQPEQAPTEIIMRRERAPNSPAAAILYPEKQIEEWRWSKAPELKQVPALEYQAKSSFDDIWNSAKDICATCAQEVEESDRRCPRCQRNLIGIQFHYPQPSASLYYLGVLTLSLGLQFMIQVGLDVTLQAQAPIVIFDGLLTVSLLILAAGVYLRRRWGYLGALVASSLVLFVSFIRMTTGVTAKNELVVLIGTLLPAVHIITSLLGILFSIFRAGPDFEIVEVRQVARLGETLRLSGDYYHTGKNYADKGMWAMAVPYWQRATASDPSHIGYRRALGEAYARLGFYERSLDMLQSAAQATVDPETKTEIEQLVQVVRKEQAQRIVNG